MKKNNFIRILFFVLIFTFLNPLSYLGMEGGTIYSYAADYYCYTDFTEADVYSTLISFKSKYPEGTPFTNDVKYTWNGGIYKTGGGCAAFTFELSDAVFGNLPARMSSLEDYNSSNILVGDIIRIENNTHSIIVLEVKSDHIVVAEANYNDSVHWGRKFTYEKLNDGTTSYIMTRYPEEISPISAVKASSISLNPQSATIYLGDVIAIKPTVLPNNVSNPSWSVGYTPLYTSIDFNDGYVLVKGLSVGETVVRVVAEDGSNVAVEFPLTIIERDENAPSTVTTIYPEELDEYVQNIEEPYTVSAVELTSIENKANGIKLSWTVNKNASGYYVYKSVGNKAFEKVKTISSNAKNSFTDKNATSNGTRYRYKIVAYKKVSDEIVKSKASNIKTYYFVSGTNIKKLTNQKGRKLYVSWAKNKKASGYQLEYAQNKKFSASKKTSVSGAKTLKKTLTKLVKNKTYYVRVRAYKKVNGKKYYSAWSTAVKIKITK